MGWAEDHVVGHEWRMLQAKAFIHGLEKAGLEMTKEMMEQGKVKCKTCGHIFDIPKANEPINPDDPATACWKCPKCE